ncbi:MAG: hypothetical protein AMJ53_06970 [Gammaproteobacteria bacterium SG8_11]|nr:MAG: hypothetical protein AMJ53_06970 [Gammaproteobacteria bacterium SG8_11]
MHEKHYTDELGHLYPDVPRCFVIFTVTHKDQNSLCNALTRLILVAAKMKARIICGLSNWRQTFFTKYQKSTFSMKGIL